jgi:5'-3' exonuclease
MGITSFYRLLAKVAPKGISTFTLLDLQKKIIGIDGKSNANIKLMGEEVLDFCEFLRKHEICPVLVFDGEPPKEKAKVLEKRKQERDRVEKCLIAKKRKLELLLTPSAPAPSTASPAPLPSAENLSPTPSLIMVDSTVEISQITQSTTAPGELAQLCQPFLDHISMESKAEISTLLSDITKNESHVAPIRSSDMRYIVQILQERGIPAFVAHTETDFILVRLLHDGLIHHIYSDDGDLLVSLEKGGILRDLTRCRYDVDAKIRYFDKLNILKEFKLDQAQFRDMAILMGCDYTQYHIKGMGPIKSYEEIKKFGSIEKFIDHPKVKLPVTRQQFLHDIGQARFLFSQFIQEVTEDWNDIRRQVDTFLKPKETTPVVTV